MRCRPPRATGGDPAASVRADPSGRQRRRSRPSRPARAMVAVRITATAPRTVRLMSPPWWHGGEFSSRRGRSKIIPRAHVPLTWVELRGLEPLTPSLRTRCATSCATAPWWRRSEVTKRQGSVVDRAAVDDRVELAVGVVRVVDQSRHARLHRATARSAGRRAAARPGRRGSWASLQAPGWVRSIAGRAAGSHRLADVRRQRHRDRLPAGGLARRRAAPRPPARAARPPRRGPAAPPRRPGPRPSRGGRPSAGRARRSASAATATPLPDRLAGAGDLAAAADLDPQVDQVGDRDDEQQRPAPTRAPA